MPITRPEQTQSMPEYSMSVNNSSSYGSAYGSNANQAVHYPPAYQRGYAAATNSASMNTATSGEQQYSYAPSYQSYKTSGNNDSEEMSDERR